MIVYSKAKINIPVDAIQKELKNASQHWQAHFNTAHYNGSWTAFPLRTPGGTDNILAELIDAATFEDHSNMSMFPSVKQLTAQLQCEIMSVRLLNLSTGSVIKQHRDMDLAFEKGEARLHIPVTTNPGVEFYVNNERVIMNEGECWYINANLPHRVANNGTADRVHLVIDCKVNPWLQELLLNTDTINHAPDENPELLKQMIISLREQNTPASLQLANDLQQQYNTLSAFNHDQ